MFAQSQPWSIPLYVVSSGVSASITQAFLALRIHRLTGQIVYLVVFFLLTAASLGGALGTAIGVIAASNLDDRRSEFRTEGRREVLARSCLNQRVSPFRTPNDRPDLAQVSATPG